MNKHLWEINHPYYCHEANFYHNGELEHFESWDEFILSYGDADLDMNLIFRWDWRMKGDWCDTSDILQLFFILQRKGIFRPIEVKVTKEDEARVIKYLTPRFHRLCELWEPFIL